MSPEDAALIGYVTVPHVVTSTTGGQHAATSYHYQGLAVDFAGPTPWNKPVVHPPLLAIWQEFMEVAGQLAELVYSGAPFWVKNGKVLPIATLPADLKAAHWNHVHVAVHKGTEVKHKVIVVPDPVPALPDYDINGAPVALTALFDSTGTCTGYLIMGSDGGVFGFGPGARYFGRVH